MGIPNALDKSKSKMKATDIDNAAGERHTGIRIHDREEPRSVYNLVSSAMQEAMDNVHPKIWCYSIAALEKNTHIGFRDNQLRIAFWQEYNAVQDNFRKKISLPMVIRNICSSSYLYDDLFRDQLKLAYMLYPVVDYLTATTEIHERSLREMRKILEIPNSHFNSRNKKVPHTTLIAQKIKIFALMDSRINGMPSQRTIAEHTHNHALHVGNQEAPKSLKDINNEIMALESGAMAVESDLDRRGSRLPPGPREEDKTTRRDLEDIEVLPAKEEPHG